MLGAPDVETPFVNLEDNRPAIGQTVEILDF
jgi:hypothetical protein